MSMRYRYEMSGTAAHGQTWKTTGEVGAFKPGEFNAALQETIRSAFMDLTNGHAVYGRPGLGCDGPYAVTRLLIEEKQDATAP